MNATITKSTHISGKEYIIINCGDYSVEMNKSDGDNYDNSICFTSNTEIKNSIVVHGRFNISWDADSDGAGIRIKFSDRWGSEMIFTHYLPSDLSGMFDFIGRGYKVFDTLFTRMKIEGE